MYSLHIKVHSVLKQFVARFSVKLYDKEQIGVKEPFPMTNLPIYLMNIAPQPTEVGQYKNNSCTLKPKTEFSFN